MLTVTQMSQAEKQDFLSKPHIGVLALNNPGHGPLTTPLWYDYSAGGEVSFIIGAIRTKAQLLQVGAQISLVAQEEKLPYSYVSIEGPVTAIEAAPKNHCLPWRSVILATNRDTSTLKQVMWQTRLESGLRQKNG